MTDSRSDFFARAATAVVAQAIKRQARLYAKRPAALEALYPGLADAPAAKLTAVAAHLVENGQGQQRRWLGFGGEVTLVNAKAALLLGRTLRRQAGTLPKSGGIHDPGLADRCGIPT